MPFRRAVSAFVLTLLLFSDRLVAATSIPFQYRDGMIWLKVAVSGRSQPLNFLLDSGAGASVIDLSTARGIGFKLGERRTALGVGGRADAYNVTGFDGRLEAGVPIAASLLAIDLTAPSHACSRHIDGLVGLDFFREHLVRIDYAAQTLHLLQRSEAGGLRGEMLPLTERNDALCARLSVGGNAPEWLRLDTGCDSSLEWVATPRRSVKGTLTTVGLISGSASEVRTDLQWGGLHLAAVKTSLHSRSMFPGESGLIGNGLLSRFILTIDAAQHRCILARAE